MIKQVLGHYIPVITAAFALPTMAYGQDATPQPDVGATTPPELRDFRLDPPPPPPGPEPDTVPSSPPTVQPPPAVPTTETPQRVEPNIAPVRETVPTSRDDTRSTNNRPSATPEIAPPPENTVPTATAPDIPKEPPAAVEVAPRIVSNPASDASGDSYWTWIGGIIILLSALFAAVFFWRRRITADAANGFNHDMQYDQPSPPTRLRKGIVDQSGSMPASAPAEPGPELSVQFIPTNAQLSLASLTVIGRLTVENRANQDVDELALRSQMISAQDGQRAAIAAFHDNQSDGETQSLGKLTPGERIDAVVEIRLSRNELHAFRWTEREFIAPIVLINISGKIANKSVYAQLSQLIGRENIGDSPRMKPLAIDRGPKRYSSVKGQPVFA
ncbi:MAG: hypothetical protein ACRCY3_00660 [Sphingorhabdus sp.]